MIVLDVFADIVCPWCYIGRGHLKQALAGRDDVTVRPRPFELAPDMPLEGKDFRAHLAQKFGGAHVLDQAFARVEGAARSAGLPVRFDRIVRTANTRRAHGLVWLADQSGQSGAMLDALYAAYFVDGQDIGDAATLQALGEGVLGAGAAGDVRAVIAGERGAAEVGELLDEAREMGISGVPLFLANEKLAVSGAQPPEVLRHLFDEAARRVA